MSASLPDLHGEAVHRPGGFFNLNKETRVRSINLADLRGRSTEDQDELEREERRKRGLYGLSNSEKACFNRFVRPDADALARANSSKEERRRSKSTARSETSQASMERKDSNQSPKGSKRRLAVLVNKQALTDLEMTEESVHRILRVLFPTHPNAMARVGCGYRRRGKSDKMLAFQTNAMSNTLPLLPSLGDERISPTGVTGLPRSFSSSLKTMSMKMERVDSNKEQKEHRPLQSPRAALDQSLKKIWPGADVQQVRKMGDLLKRELNLRSHVKTQGEQQLPRRQPLYVTPEAAGTKTQQKEFTNSAKLESSLSGEIWDSTATGDSKSRQHVFHRMKNAAFLVSKIGEITEEITKERTEIKKLQRKQAPSVPIPDDCNFSLRSFRKRLLGKHQCLADAFRVLDLNVNQKIGPQEWGAMFRGSGLATFREARMSFELLDLNRDGSVTLAEFQAALEGVAEIAGIDGLRKRLVSFGYTKTLQVLEIIEASGIDPSKPLTLEEFGSALCRIHVVEPMEHQAIFDNVRDRGDPSSKASVNDLMAALGSVGPWMLLEDLADRARQKWDSVDATWTGLGPASGDAIKLQAFEKKLEKLGLKPMAAQKASRILDVDSGGELSRSELLSALALSRPTLHMEDFRRKVQQRYRSIEAIFRESFEHMENEELNNDDDMRLTCDEFGEILEALDFSRRETSYLFWLADANGTKRLTLYEFFRGVKLFVPSCMVEALRLQALTRHTRISDLFRGCGVSWEKRLNSKAFAQLLQKLDIKCEDPGDAFDFLDVRSCGTISLREVVATLQNVMPGTKERSTLWECDRKAEKDVRTYMAPLHKTVTAIKTTMKQSIDEDSPWDLAQLAKPCSSRNERRRSSSHLAFAKTDLGFALAQETFQRISGDASPEGHRHASQPKATDYCGKNTVDRLCGYLQSSSDTMELHGKLLSHHYSRTDWHKRRAKINAVLTRKI